ncbi:MAG TPA: zinc carboxypeptidase [Bacteroidales bacterium]|nr:zinc carboxypeptidase [Bacteroidales bacterium]
MPKNFPIIFNFKKNEYFHDRIKKTKPMKTYFMLISLFLAVPFGFAQTDLNYYLPKDVNYDINIPTPKQVLGYEVGDWMVSHDQLIKYMETIANVSDRAIMVEYARSYENRPLFHLVFSSPENLANLEQIKADHQKLSDPKLAAGMDTEKLPLIVVLGYSIHGNEASGVNASLLTAYYLAAASSSAIKDLLKNTIIFVDPALNPDGVNRFANWVNQNKSFANLSDPNSRVFNEAYPGGRSNHYWFDMNRDYLLLTNPESRGRAKFIQEWNPNIVTDHHEMGSNSTFFFQPGVPSRNNPLTPRRNYELTKAIAEYHAKFLDQIGSLYFSEEQFDDYYFGKGSSYPDINAGIGILFEQASSRGFVRETANGVLTFPFTIRNQFTVSLSSLEAARNLRKPLLDYQKEFYSSALEEANKDAILGWVFGDKNDLGKMREFLNILKIHAIEFSQLTENYSANGKIFEKESSYFVATSQKNYRLLKSIFEKSSSFEDKTFYDVSTWNFFYAFNMPNMEIKKGKGVNVPKSTVVGQIVSKKGQLIGSERPLAYAFRWDDYFAPKLLAAIQSKGIKAKVATKEFSYQADNLNEYFSFGTILITSENQQLGKAELHKFLSNLAQECGIDLYCFSSGYTAGGIDLGSDSFAKLEKPRVLIFVGGRSDSRDAGEIWHLFDQRYSMPVSLVEQNTINRIDLAEYTTIVLPGGSFDELGKAGIEKLQKWISDGGNLISYKDATQWAAKNLNLDIKFKKEVELNFQGIPSFVNKADAANVQDISGAIFEVYFDPSHPIAYGLPGKTIPIFKTGASVAEMPEGLYRTPFRYSASPLLSGYCSIENNERIKSAPFVIASPVGRGKVISILDDANFRGFWYGSNKVFANAVFFGKIF